MNLAICETKEGYLFKKEQESEPWEKNWFILKNGIVQYSASKEQRKSVKTFNTNGSRLNIVDQGLQGKVFTLTPRSQNSDQQRTYILRAENNQVQQDWIAMFLNYGAFDDSKLINMGSNRGILMEGWLESKDMVSNQWKKRYCVLLPHRFHHFKENTNITHNQNQIPDVAIPLFNHSVVSIVFLRTKLFFVLVSAPDGPNSESFPYCFFSNDTSTLIKWIDRIQNAIDAREISRK